MAVLHPTGSALHETEVSTRKSKYTVFNKYIPFEGVPLRPCGNLGDFACRHTCRPLRRWQVPTLESPEDPSHPWTRPTISLQYVHNSLDHHPLSQAEKQGLKRRSGVCTSRGLVGTGPGEGPRPVAGARASQPLPAGQPPSAVICMQARTGTSSLDVL